MCLKKCPKCLEFWCSLYYKAYFQELEMVKKIRREFQSMTKEEDSPAYRYTEKNIRYIQ
jgi:hypothetical protein